MIAKNQLKYRMDYSKIIIPDPGSVKQGNSCNFAKNFKNRL